MNHWPYKQTTWLVTNSPITIFLKLFFSDKGTIFKLELSRFAYN